MSGADQDQPAEETQALAKRPWPPPGPDNAWWRGDSALRASSGTPDRTPDPVPVLGGDRLPETPVGRTGSAEPTVPADLPTAASTAPADAKATVASVGEDVSTSRNAPPSGFPTDRMTGTPGQGPARSAPIQPTASHDVEAALVRSARAERHTVPPRREALGSPGALSLFFEPDPGGDAVWPAAVTRVPTGHRPDTPVPSGAGRPRKNPRSPFAGLVALVVLAFVATFFAWFAAGPFWLSVGHARTGVATVANCPVNGIDRRCARFVAADDAYTAQVTLLGPSGADAKIGATVPAKMVTSESSMAYAGDQESLYLRWIPGFAIVVLCGFGIAWATGAYRVERRRRGLAFLLSMAGPILIAAGMLAATW